MAKVRTPDQKMRDFGYLQGLTDPSISEAEELGPLDPQITPAENGNRIFKKIVNLPIAKIKRGKYQPRLEFRDIEGLASSISENGLINPVIVRPLADGNYELIAGERRYRAYNILSDRPTIPAIVRDLSDELAALESMKDNKDREDLSDYETFVGLERLQAEGFVSTHADLRRILGIPKSSMSKLMSYRNLPAEAKNILNQHPRLLGSNAASILASERFSKRADIVIGALNFRFKDANINENVSENAMLAWAEQQLKGKKEAKPQDESRQLMVCGIQVAKFKVKGRQITFYPAKGTDPEDLIEQIKKALGAEEKPFDAEE